MLSGLMASPTLDLGVGQTKNAPAKTISAVNSSASISEASINPVTRAVISMEYASLRHNKHCPTGMYITPSTESILVWDAVLFLHQGYYAGSVLKFLMIFPDTYPDRLPTVRFLTDVFHPLVATQTGSFNLTARFRPWRPKEHHIHDILHFIKVGFKEPTLDNLHEMDVVNKEAFKLYRDNRSSFAALAQQSSQLSQSPTVLYDSPSSRKDYSFLFAPTKPEQVNGILGELSIHTSSEGTQGQQRRMKS